MRHLFSGFFQLGYVTRDIDAACAAFCRKFGQVDFMMIHPDPVDGVAPPARRIALTYIDDVMTEIIEPAPAQNSIYTASIPPGEGVLRLHHLGHLIDDHDRMLTDLERLNYQTPMHGRVAGVLDYIYADTRDDLGVWSEFIRLDEGGRDWFAAVPRHRVA